MNGGRRSEPRGWERAQISLSSAKAAEGSQVSLSLVLSVGISGMQVFLLLFLGSQSPPSFPLPPGWLKGERRKEGVDGTKKTWSSFHLSTIFLPSLPLARHLLPGGNDGRRRRKRRRRQQQQQQRMLEYKAKNFSPSASSSPSAHG